MVKSCKLLGPKGRGGVAWRRCAMGRVEREDGGLSVLPGGGLRILIQHVYDAAWGIYGIALGA